MLRSILGAVSDLFSSDADFQVTVMAEEGGVTTIRLTRGGGCQADRLSFGWAVFKTSKSIGDAQFHACEHAAQVTLYGAVPALRIKAKLKPNKRTTRARLALNQVKGLPVIDVLVPPGATVSVMQLLAVAVLRQRPRSETSEASRNGQSTTQGSTNGQPHEAATQS